jgi:hypothetical protein
MIEYRKIWANARYEIITLLRGWFFRIFAGSMIALFIFMNIIFFSGVLPFVPRIFAGFSGAIPYANMILLNMAQIAVIIFMASDFFKRDRKFNTAEVFYIRSMTNANYLLGKALGVFLLFSSLNIIILIIALTIHLVFNEISFNWVPYLLYPFLLGIPAFVFMIGLSFLLMHLIKNQAIVVLLLLGYYAGSLFYLYDKWYFIFDFIGFRIPFAYSDFISIANLEVILLQRGLYFSLGVFCILLSILIFQRLAQSVILQRMIIAGLIFFTITSFYCAINYINFYTYRHELRTRMTEINRDNTDYPELKPLSCRIDLYHLGKSYRATAWYVVQNSTKFPIDQYLFSINPGLKVEQVKKDNLIVEHTQEDHIIRIKIQKPLNPGLKDSIQLNYSGQLEEAACYLDIEDFEDKNSYGFWLFQSARKHVFLEDDYVLLPPESMWYPRPGLPQGINFLNRTNRQFIKFQLDVHTKTDLTALSQGTKHKIESGYYRFTSEFPFSDISLILGKYQEKSIKVDSVDYHLYHLSNHDYYKDYFSQIGDTLTDVIREFVQDYEVRLDLEYPFNKLSLIEVPLPYYVYPRIWTVAQEVVLPEKIWFKENAARIASADFGIMDRRLDRSNQTMTEDETQISILKTFLNSVFGGKATQGRRFGGPRAEYQPNYNLFPNFYTYVSYLEGEDWPILNTALEAFLSDRVQEAEENMPIWRTGEITDAEKVSQALSTKSLAEYLTTLEDKLILPEMIKQKGAFLIKLLQNELGLEAFNSYLSQIIHRSKFRPMDFNNFFGDLALRPEFNIESYLHTWYYDKVLPAYLVRDVKFYKVYDGDRIRTQVNFKTSNTDSTDGLLEVSFQYSRRGMGFGMGAANEEVLPTIFRLDGNQNKQFGLLLDEEPRALNINFLLARNLPLVYTRRFDKAELDENKAPFEGERLITGTEISTSPGEIIVDNYDNGFEIFNPPFNSLIKQWIHNEEEDNDEMIYENFHWWNPPHQWRPIKSATFYGTYVHSAYYIRPGDGSKYVSWNAQLKTAGIYDIYIYMFNKEDFQRRRRERRNNMFGDFTYQVYHDGGIEEIALSVDGAPAGWNFLGSWFFSEGIAKVVLTDETTARFVIADAVKWVKN